MSKIKRAIGLMSGTSMDGIDVAAIETDGRSVLRRAGYKGFPYTPEFQNCLLSAIDDARGLTDRSARPGAMLAAERELTRLHIEAVTAFMDANSWQPEDIDVVGFHGQTLLHRPEIALTVQIGDGQALADGTGLPVVCDLRAADVAAGGQGAPMAPVYHQALVAEFPERPVAVLNVGGVSNVTLIGAIGELVSFDTGPGNALIDDWIRTHTNQSYDQGGAIAANGRVDRKIVETFLSQPYFKQRPPKSLDRDAWTVSGVDALSLNDAAATLTALTAESIAAAAALLPAPPRSWVVCGGGRHNKTLMAMLEHAVESRVLTAEQAGWNGDSIEAEAWAYMAVRSLEGLPISFPGTTGVKRPLTGGVICNPATLSATG